MNKEATTGTSNEIIKTVFFQNENLPRNQRSLMTQFRLLLLTQEKFLSHFNTREIFNKTILVMFLYLSPLISKDNSKRVKMS